MSIRVSAGALILLQACVAVPTVPEDEACVANSPPEIGNLEINSLYDEATATWEICFHVDWIDPGRVDGQQGTDPPNMIGGIISMEIRGYAVPSLWIPEGTGMEGAQIGATSGELQWYVCPAEGAAEDAPIEFAARLHDRCDASSNDKTGIYYLGDGHRSENPEATGSACQPTSFLNPDGTLRCFQPAAE
jgi:hypothetical protein